MLEAERSPEMPSKKNPQPSLSPEKASFSFLVASPNRKTGSAMADECLFIFFRLREGME